MSDDFQDRSRRLEDDYFRRKDLELIEKIREAAAAKAAHTALGEAAGVSDPALIDQLKELGFTPDTVGLFPFLPLIQVAWVDGTVTPQERDALLRLAEARGIGSGTPAYERLTEWITHKPTEAQFARAQRLIGALLATGATAVSGLTAEELIRHSESIATASGGVFGFGSMSHEEKRLLSELATALVGRRQ